MIKNNIIIMGIILIIFSCSKTDKVEIKEAEKDNGTKQNPITSTIDKDEAQKEVIPEPEPEPIITKITNINKAKLLNDIKTGVIFPDFGYEMGDYIPQKDFGFKYLPENNIIYIESEAETEYLVKLIDPNENTFIIENIFAEITPYSDATFLNFKFYNYASQTRGIWKLELLNKETEIETLYDFEVKSHSVTISKENLESPFTKNKTYSLKVGQEFNIYINNISEDSKSFQIFENINDEFYSDDQMHGEIYRPFIEIECDFVNRKWSGVLTIGEDLLERTFAIGYPVLSEDHVISWASDHRIFKIEK